MDRLHSSVLNGHTPDGDSPTLTDVLQVQRARVSGFDPALKSPDNAQHCQHSETVRRDLRGVKSNFPAEHQIPHRSFSASPIPHFSRECCMTSLDFSLTADSSTHAPHDPSTKAAAQSSVAEMRRGPCRPRRSVRRADSPGGTHDLDLSHPPLLRNTSVDRSLGLHGRNICSASCSTSRLVCPVCNKIAKRYTCRPCCSACLSRAVWSYLPLRAPRQSIAPWLINRGT